MSRDVACDNLKGFLILMVIVTHIYGNYDGISVFLNSFYNCVHLFMMPGFVFLSGYFSKDVDRARENAVKSFLIPYSLIDTTLAFLDWIRSGNNRCFFEVFNIATPRWALWYLLCMFYWRSFAKDIMRLRKPVLTVVVLSLAMPVFRSWGTPFALGRATAFLVFFAAGLCFKESWMEELKTTDPLVGLMGMTLMVMIGVTLMRYGLLTRETLYANKPYPADGMFMGMVMRIEFYVISSVMVVSLLVLIPKRSCVLTNIGRNSITAYVLHVFVVFFLRKLGLMRMLLPSGEFGMLFMAFVWAFLMAILFTAKPIVKAYGFVMDSAIEVLYGK